MTDRITRHFLIEKLPAVERGGFLCYLMGPYKSFNLNDVLSPEEQSRIDIEDLPGPLRRLFRSEDELSEAQALLRRIQGALRLDPQVNAFLALDIDVDIDDVDAVTQSIEFAHCSNAAAFIVPFLGHNFGVGEEAGSVLEAGSEMNAERLIFLHEKNVTSAMIHSARDRWDVRIAAYESETDLIDQLREFVAEVMHMERVGLLPEMKTGER